MENFEKTDRIGKHIPGLDKGEANLFDTFSSMLMVVIIL